MGAGRKTYTYTLDDSPIQRRGSRARKFRGLSKPDLAGVIFGCTPDTYEECVTELIFGLPASHIAYVQNIGPGMPLFLFNYIDRKMHGTFQAESYGQMNINSSGWTADGADKTHYPAQVRVCIRKSCEPLSESAFKTIISENYYTNAHFWFELDRSQVDALMTLFLSRSSDIDFPKSPDNGTLCKGAPNYSNVWKTASADKSLDYAEMGLDGNSYGDRTMMPPKDKDMPYRRGGDPWEEHSESSHKNKEICKIIDSEDEMEVYRGIIRSLAVLLKDQPESVEIGPATNGTVKNSSNENHELHVSEKVKRLAINQHNSSGDWTIDSEDEMAAYYGGRITSPTVSLNDQPESVEIGPSTNGTVKSSPNENRELHASEKLKRLAINRHNSVPIPTACESAKDDNKVTIILEQCQFHIEQMQQEMAELKAYVKKNPHEFQSATEIKELQNKSHILQQKQVIGAGRKTYMDDCKIKGGGARGGGNFRGLNRPDLAGLPPSHIAYVQNIGPGMPLFLFNYSDRKMHGIFKAASYGQMNINPQGWKADFAEKRPFPAQVRVCMGTNCEPLSESAFKTIMSENYYTNTHFWFELDHSQVDALTTLFLSRYNRRSADIDSPKSPENGTWLCKRALNSSKMWQTVAGKSLDYSEMGLDGNSSGDWTMAPPKDKDMPYRRGGDPREENGETSHKNKEICKIKDSDDEKAAYEEIIRSPTVSLNCQPESVEIGPATNETVKNSSNENRKLIFEELKRLVIDRQNSLLRATTCESAKDDNNITIIPEHFQKYIEQIKQEWSS